MLKSKIRIYLNDQYILRRSCDEKKITKEPGDGHLAANYAS